MSEDAAAILERARAIAREQRDPDSETHVDFPPAMNPGTSMSEAMLYQEIRRLWDALGVPFQPSK